MTNNELEQLLKLAKIPEREKSFWENFSQNVTRRMRIVSSRHENKRRPNLSVAVWGVGLATACLAMALWFEFHKAPSHGTEEQLAAARKYFQEVESLFPNQVRAISFESGKARLILAEKADIPTSSPLFLKICSGKKCRSLITFSGQQIQINGEAFEVLSDRQGQILLVGNHSVWSSANPVQTKNSYIQAQTLEL